ncbi:hypothetical protein GCM10023213_44960 [Prosthecobacter algae]|uniref:Uncharacterized protein n=1 Tax=Prosthecobacter algae TaxID=1144682 RepID=A0ABP9PMH4_9BACT
MSVGKGNALFILRVVAGQQTEKKPKKGTDRQEDAKPNHKTGDPKPFLILHALRLRRNRSGINPDCRERYGTSALDKGTQF